MDSWVSILLGFLELVSLGTMNKRAKVDAEPVSLSMPVAILVAAFTGCVLSVCFLAFLFVSALLGWMFVTLLLVAVLATAISYWMKRQHAIVGRRWKAAACVTVFMVAFGAPVAVNGW